VEWDACPDIEAPPIDWDHFSDDDRDLGDHGEWSPRPPQPDMPAEDALEHTQIKFVVEIWRKTKFRPEIDFC
jgi:hypothetical protein